MTWQVLNPYDQECIGSVELVDWPQIDRWLDEARALLPMQVRYTPRTAGDPAAVAANLPSGAELRGDAWHFAIQDADVEPLLARITASGHGVTGLSISRPALHDAFVHIVRQVDAGFDADATEDAVEEASA